jgi:hypothetical protein
VSKFKARPESPAQPDPVALAAFVSAADSRSTVPVGPTAPTAPTAMTDEPPRIAIVPDVVEQAPSTPAIHAVATVAPTATPRRPRREAAATAPDGAPWEKFDRHARPLSGINVRLNDYEHELLKHLAEADQRSLQQTIKRLLIPAAEAAARTAKRGD